MPGPPGPRAVGRPAGRTPSGEEMAAYKGHAAQPRPPLEPNAATARDPSKTIPGRGLVALARAARADVSPFVSPSPFKRRCRAKGQRNHNPRVGGSSPSSGTSGSPANRRAFAFGAKGSAPPGPLDAAPDHRRHPNGRSDAGHRRLERALRGQRRRLLRGTARRTRRRGVHRHPVRADRARRTRPLARTRAEPGPPLRRRAPRALRLASPRLRAHAHDPPRRRLPEPRRAFRRNLDPSDQCPTTGRNSPMRRPTRRTSSTVLALCVALAGLAVSPAAHAKGGRHRLTTTIDGKTTVRQRTR